MANSATVSDHRAANQILSGADLSDSDAALRYDLTHSSCGRGFEVASA